MKTSIATVSVPGTLREKLEAIAAAGFDGVEIFEQDFIADAASPRDVGAMIRDQGLAITLFQPFRDFEGLPPGPLRRRALDRARHKFDLMNDLGTDLVLVCSSVHPEALGGIDRAADDFAELGALAATHGIRVGYEALAWGRHVNDHRDAWEIVRRADHSNVGLILDSFHTLGRGIDPDTIRRIPGDRIFFVQLADAPAIPMDLLYWSRHFRCMPGEGDLDVTAFTRAVLATGYRGPVSLEVFNDQFRGGLPGPVARDGFRSLVSHLDDVRRTEPGCADIMPDIPPRATVLGVGFLEFASRGDEAVALGALLATLGFAHVAQHRTKALALWQQGEIRILINEEPGDFAGSVYNARGTGVCDIGLTVGAATATVARAQALGAAPFAQPLSPGQVDIPAIRGLGSSALHLLDTTQPDVWTAEFIPQGAAAPDAGLTRIDHFAQTMTYADMLSWASFYTSLLQMTRSPMIDVTDPDGLVRSLALAAPGGGLRITLNGAETHRTLAGAFLAETFGAPVQHVALASDDILATARALAARGFASLPMTDNYYADLVSRFDIAPDLLAALQAHDILYDRDAGGEFFQIYSRPFAGGMFFEIVERRGDYRGYGAPNAAFRIAAQKRLMRGAAIPRG